MVNGYFLLECFFLQSLHVFIADVHIRALTTLNASQENVKLTKNVIANLIARLKQATMCLAIPASIRINMSISHIFAFRTMVNTSCLKKRKLFRFRISFHLFYIFISVFKAHN